jgi:hypothetical protein
MRNSGIWEKQSRAHQLTAERAALFFSGRGYGFGEPIGVGSQQLTWDPAKVYVKQKDAPDSELKPLE